MENFDHYVQMSQFRNERDQRQETIDALIEDMPMWAKAYKAAYDALLAAGLPEELACAIVHVNGYDLGRTLG